MIHYTTARRTPLAYVILFCLLACPSAFHLASAYCPSISDGDRVDKRETERAKSRPYCAAVLVCPSVCGAAAAVFARAFCCLIEVTMPLICAAEAEEKIPVSSNGRRNELALIRLYIYREREGRSEIERDIEEEEGG